MHAGKLYTYLACGVGCPELLMKMSFTLAIAPHFVHPMISLLAMPTNSIWKYGFFSEPVRQRQVAKYHNLKHCESLSFSGDRELRAFQILTLSIADSWYS